MKRLPILVCLIALVAGGVARGEETEACEPGIYLEQPGKVPVKLAQTAMGGPSMKGMAGGMAKTIVTGGLLRPSTVYVFEGAKSRQRVSADVSFKFCFDAEAGATPSGPVTDPEQAMEMMSRMQSGMPPGVVKPQEFALVRLGVDGEARTMALGGMTGTKPKNKVDFHVAPLGPGVFRVRAKELLSPGEYGFFRMQAGGIFDFAIE